MATPAAGRRSPAGQPNAIRTLYSVRELCHAHAIQRHPDTASRSLIQAIQTITPAPLKDPSQILYSRSPGVEVHPSKPEAPTNDWSTMEHASTFADPPRGTISPNADIGLAFMLYRAVDSEAMRRL